MTALAAFRPRVAMLAPTATDPMIDQCVLDACIDFCERSLVVKRMLTGFPTVAGTPVYAVATPTDTSLVMLQRVWCDTRQLTPLDEDGIASPAGFAVVAQEGIGRPRYFNQTDPGAISLYPRPDDVYQITIRAALRPTRTATTVPSQLFEDWVEGITSGALSRLFLAPGDLLNAPLAKYHSANFESFVNVAMQQATAGRVRSEMAVTPVHI